jgi:hypothetical protein
MKKIFTSYIISFPLVIIGIVCLAQASNPNFLVSADQLVVSDLPVGLLLYIVGILFIILGGALIILRFTLKSREKNG